jgi:glycosyltransferase involved in cell wall biosynthesis
MNTISAIILAHNEEKTIKQAIDSVAFASEIIVINDRSTDNTTQYARDKGARVINQVLNNNFAKQRNNALQYAKHNWVLFLDADERVSRALQEEVKQLDENSLVGAFLMLRVDHFWGRELRHGETARCRVPRLVHKKRGVFERPVHEVWRSSYSAKTLQNQLDHYPHQTLNDFIHHVNYYSTINARYFKQMGKTTSIFDIMLTPLLKFFYTYFVKGGVLDGAPGFIYSFMMSFHSFLSRAKLYLLSQQK